MRARWELGEASEVLVNNEVEADRLEKVAGLRSSWISSYD